MKIYDKVENKYIIKKELYNVPTVEILNLNLYEIDKKNFYCNEKDMCDIFREKKIWYYGIGVLIKD